MAETIAAKATGQAPKTFAAFVGEDALDAVKDAASESGIASPRVVRGTLEEAIRQLAKIATPQQLVVDLSEVPDPLAAIGSLAAVCDPGTKVIALGTINDVGLYRSLIGHGVHDYLVKPVEAAALSSALMRAAGGPQGDAAAAKPGRLIAVVGARGGVGATSVAVNLAWTIAHEQNRRVALVDLDLFFGTCALALDLEMGHGFREAMENPARMDSLFIERSMVRESENLFVLSAEEALDAAFNFDAQAIELLLEHLRRDFQYVVMDFPRYGVRRQARVLTPPAAVVVVSDASLAGMRDTMRLTKLLKSAVPNAEVTVSMNRVGAEKSGELGRTEFEKGAETKVDLLIPFEAKGFAASAAAGKPVVKVAGRTKAAAAIRALARRLATTSAGKAKGPVWQRILKGGR